MKKTILVVAALGLGLAACSGNRVTSYTDPEYRSNQQQDWRVVVVGKGMDLAEQQALEAAAVEEFSEAGVTAFKSVNILRPTKEYSEEEQVAELKKAGAQVALEIVPTGKDRQTRTDPVMVSPGYTSTTAYHREGQLVDTSSGQILTPDRTYYRTTHHPGHVSGGYSYTKSYAKYTARLVNLESGDVMWRGDAQITGGSKFEGLAEDMGEEAVEKLLEDGFFYTKQ